MAIDLERMRALARQAALVGAEVVRGSRRPAAGKAKGLPGDWVTEVDLAAERAIAAYLGAEAPGVPLHGEETAEETAMETAGPTTGLRWVVDPLDGTTNYLHGFFAVGVSVALVEDDTPLAGAVSAPFLGDLWHAARGAGAVWEPPGGPPRAAHISERPAAQAVVGTGFPFRHEELRPRYLRAFAAALETFEDLRRPGAASLDLAWVASGVFDGFFELGLEPWDVAAGGLLIEEAGGTVTDWDGTPAYLSGNILAGSPQVHAELLRIASSTI